MIYVVLTKVIVFNANSVDPDQTPDYVAVASDQGLHFLTMFLLLDTR